LKDHLDLFAQRTELAFGQPRDVAPVEDHLAAIDADQLEQAFSYRGLARSGLAHDAQCLAAPDSEADAVDCAHGALAPQPAPAGDVSLVEVAHFEHRLIGVARFLRMGAAAWHCADQALGVRVPGRVENLVGRPLFDQFAAFHDGDAMRNFRNDAEVTDDDQPTHARYSM